MRSGRTWRARKSERTRSCRRSWSRSTLSSQAAGTWPSASTGTFRTLRFDGGRVAQPLFGDVVCARVHGRTVCECVPLGTRRVVMKNKRPQASALQGQLPPLTLPSRQKYLARVGNRKSPHTQPATHAGGFLVTPASVALFLAGCVALKTLQAHQWQARRCSKSVRSNLTH